MKRIAESSRGYLRRNLFRKYVLSMRRGIKIFRFLHGLVMEALSRDGSSFWEGVVRRRGKGCPLFRS